MRKKPAARPSLFIEHQITEEAFVKLPHEHRETIQRYGIPIEAPKGYRRFKITRDRSRKLGLK